MATSTGEKLEQIGAQDDYGQALGEGEITRILKTVQAAQFKKSETLVITEDTEFKPRSLVEIAFAAEGKRKEAEEAAEQKLKQQSSGADEGEPVSGSLDQAASVTVGEQESLPHTASQKDEISDQVADEISQETVQAQQHTEEAQKQRADEDEAIRLAADEEGYKRGFEAGLEAARTAEPTPEEAAFLEEKEKERQAVIDKFHKAITAISSPQAIDSSALEASINEAVVELASERAGQEITENPEAFLVRIKKLVEDIKIGTQQIEILLNPSDLAAIEGWMQDRPLPTGWQFSPDNMLANGDMHLKIGGIEISDKIHPDSDKKAETLGQNSEKINENLDYGSFNVSPEQNLDVDDQAQSDNQNAEDLSGVTADETPSIPVLEGFEPIETGDESLQSNNQNAEDLSGVAADETSSIPVLEGFEPIGAGDESLQSDNHHEEADPVSDANEEETADSNSSLQRAKVAKRPAFVPDASEEVELENDISSLPVLEGFEPIEGDE